MFQYVAQKKWNVKLSECIKKLMQIEETNNKTLYLHCFADLKKKQS